MSARDVSAVVIAMNVLYESENQLKPILKQHGISMNEWLVLKVRYLDFATTPSEIAAYLNMQRASITRHVENLCVRKLLSRNYSKEDRRVVELVVTDAGIKLCKKIFSYYPHITRKVDNRLQGNERKLWKSIS